MVKTAIFIFCLLQVLHARHVYLASNTSTSKITNTTHQISQTDELDLEIDQWYWGWYDIYWMRHHKTLPKREIAFQDGVRILKQGVQTRSAPQGYPYFYYINYEATFEPIDINPVEATLFLGCMDQCKVYFNDELIIDSCCHLNTTTVKIRPERTNNLTVLNLQHKDHYAGVIFYLYEFQEAGPGFDESAAEIAIPTILLLVFFIAIDKYLKKEMMEREARIREEKKQEHFETAETLVRESPALLRLD